MNDELEGLIWCKQSIMRILAYLSFQPNICIDELCAMLNDVEGRDDETKALQYFIKALETYKSERE